MKIFKQLLKTCCLFFSAALLVFITTNVKAQSPPVPPYCAVPTGYNVTLTANCGSVQLGTSYACGSPLPYHGWVEGVHHLGGTCPTSGITYSWAPSTNLSCTTCAQPYFGACGTTTFTTTYTLTISAGGLSTESALVTATYKSSSGSCSMCRIGYFTTPTVEVENKGIKVFPNPSSGKITVTFDVINPNTNIEVYNMEGELVSKKNNLADKTVELDLSSVAKGVYFIQVLNGDKGILNKKIIIQ